MMKLTSLLAVSTCMLSALAVFGTVDAHAAKKANTFSREYGMAGCGLGSIVMGKRGSQVLAGTTNGTSYSQSFGITFGTSNCDDSAAAETASRMDIFVTANKVALANDIARGGGETLNSVSSILKCSDSVTFSSAMQENFSEIFPRHDVQANEITDSIITTVIQNPSLSKTCEVTTI